jgi:signal transduction histidine kinase
MSLETDQLSDLTERQKLAARLAGAITHELNNPLQGILSLFALCKADCGRQNIGRMNDIESGLTRLSRVVDTIGVIHQNLPRPVDETSVGDFLDLLVAAFEERQMAARIMLRAPRDLRFYAMVPETIRLIREVFVLSSAVNGAVNIEVELLNGRALIACERESSDTIEPWCGLDDHPVCSGLAVLIDEMTRLAGGEPEFRFDHASLSGIRLCFRTRMN